MKIMFNINYFTKWSDTCGRYKNDVNIPLCENCIFKESHAASFCLVAALWRLILTFNFIRRDIIAIKSDIKNTLASCTDNEQAT